MPGPAWSNLKKRRKKSKRDVGQNGRNENSKYVAIQESMMRTAAFKSLTAVEQAAYVQVKRRFNGMNNGRLGVSARILAGNLNTSKDTAMRALRRLVEVGFLEVVTPSGFCRKNRLATEYRLTEADCGVTNRLATHAYRDWRPPEPSNLEHSPSVATVRSLRCDGDT